MCILYFETKNKNCSIKIKIRIDIKTYCSCYPLLYYAVGGAFFMVSEKKIRQSK